MKTNGQFGNQQSSKYLLLCSADERTDFHFGLNYPFNIAFSEGTTKTLIHCLYHL